MTVAAGDLSTSAEDGNNASGHLELACLHHAEALTGLMRAIAVPTAELIASAWACNSLFAPYDSTTTADVAPVLFTAEPFPGFSRTRCCSQGRAVEHTSATLRRLVPGHQ